MLVKHNNNSISSITTPGSLAQGKMTLISEQTASGSASISFTSGIDSTYPIYRFEFINMHPSVNKCFFGFQTSTNGGSSYGVTCTSTCFGTGHTENDVEAILFYASASDLAQSTSYPQLGIYDRIGIENDMSLSGSLILFNPSSTTFVKHFMFDSFHSGADGGAANTKSAGYFNTTSAINAIDFKFFNATSNIDDGTIKLYGIKGD